MMALALGLILRAVIKRRRWNFSLGYLFLFVHSGSLGLWGVVDWWRAVEAQAQYEASLREYNLRYALEQKNADTSKIPGFNQDQWNRNMAADPYARLCKLWTGCMALPKDVGLKAPNAMGFFDMQGNVWELCYDNMVHTNHAYRVETQPTLEFLETYAVPYVLCGGGFDSNPRECRTGYRLRT